MGQTGISRYGIHRYGILHLLAVRYGVSIFFMLQCCEFAGLVFTLSERTIPKRNATVLYIRRRTGLTEIYAVYFIGIYLHRNREVTME
jgi:hypothetical protein